MYQENTLNLRIDTIAGTGRFGRAVGSELLLPMINSDIPALRTIVVAIYGDIAVGKTKLLTGCAEGRGAPLTQHAIEFGHQETTQGSKLFRYMDVSDDIDARDDIYVHQVHFRKDRKPRKALRVPGIDLLEHAPLGYLGSSSVIITIAKPTDDSYAQERINSAPENTERRLRYETAALKILHDQFSLAAASAVKPVSNPRARIVSMSLISNNRTAHRMFNNFKQDVKEHLRLKT